MHTPYQIDLDHNYYANSAQNQPENSAVDNGSTSSTQEANGNPASQGTVPTRTESRESQAENFEGDAQDENNLLNKKGEDENPMPTVEWTFIPRCLRDRKPAEDVDFLDSRWQDYDQDLSRWLIVSNYAAVLFGGAHCFAWNFMFPTHAERWLWRIASVGTCVIPGIFLIVRCCRHFFIYEKKSWGWAQVTEEQGLHIYLRVCFFTLLVLRAYISLAVLISLRLQHKSLYEVVPWIRILPHIS